jgi:hypothetical protein
MHEHFIAGIVSQKVDLFPGNETINLPLPVLEHLPHKLYAIQALEDIQDCVMFKLLTSYNWRDTTQAN